MPVSHAKFVEAWSESESVQEVADKLEISKASVSTRATKLRKAGVILKNMGVGVVDVDALNKLIVEKEELKPAEVKKRKDALKPQPAKGRAKK